MTDALLDGLNPRQLEAVTLPDQNVLILAGAGSGKTRVLTSRIAWLIREGRARLSSIMAVTFTNKASREMLGRIESLMNVNTRGMWVGTFHGLCNRMLRIHASDAGLPEGFQILDQSDQLSAVKRVMKAANVGKETIEPKAVQNFINAQKEAGLRSAEVRSGGASQANFALCLDLYRLYERLCAEEGIVDFAELMLRSYELLLRNEMIRSHYQRKFTHILVDEFQDTNVLQYKWLKVLSGYGFPGGREAGVSNSVFAVGDDDQSIYAFRGANVGNMSDFTRELGVERVVKLEQNYRSVGHILEAANALISNNDDRLGKNLWTDAGSGERIRVMPCVSGEAEARFVAEEIDAEHLRGKNYSDFAVLYRSNAQSRALESVLMSSGIPYRIYGGHRFFERAHVKDVLAYLRLIENPNDNTSFLRVVNVPARGIGAKTIETLSSAASNQSVSLMEAACAAGGKASDFASLIQSARAFVSQMPLVDLIRAVIARSGLGPYYEAVDKKEHSAKCEDLAEIENAAASFLENNGLPANAPALFRISDEELSPLSAFLALATLEAGDNQADASSDAVQMMTVHASKGLEFPAVFITGLEENLFPHISSVREGDTGLSEERRLMYVAITRAKKSLYLSFAGSRFINGQTQSQSMSSFIDEIPAEHLKWLAKKRDAEREGWNRTLRSSGWKSEGGTGFRNYGSGSGSSYGRSSSGYSRGEGFSDSGYSSGYSSSRSSGYSSGFSSGSSAGTAAPKTGFGSGSSIRDRAAEASGGFRTGDKVRHPKFGSGVIVTVVGSGDAAKITVAFAGAGVKTLLSRIAKLEKI